MPPKRKEAPSKGNQASKKGNQASKKGKKTAKEKARQKEKVDDKVVKPRKIKDQKSKAFVESEESENEQEQKENKLPVRRSRRSTKKAIEEDEGDDEIGIDGELDELINQSEKRGRTKENRAKKQLQRKNLIGKANEKKRIRNVFKLILANQRRF